MGLDVDQYIKYGVILGGSNMTDDERKCLEVFVRKFMEYIDDNYDHIHDEIDEECSEELEKLRKDYKTIGANNIYEYWKKLNTCFRYDSFDNDVIRDFVENMDDMEDTGYEIRMTYHGYDKEDTTSDGETNYIIISKNMKEIFSGSAGYSKEKIYRYDIDELIRLQSEEDEKFGKFLESIEFPNVKGKLFAYTLID